MPMIQNSTTSPAALRGTPQRGSMSASACASARSSVASARCVIAAVIVGLVGALLDVEHRQALQHQLARDAQRAHDGRAVGLERGDQRRDDGEVGQARRQAVQHVGIAAAHALHEAAVRGLRAGRARRRKRQRRARSRRRASPRRRAVTKGSRATGGNNAPPAARDWRWSCPPTLWSGALPPRAELFMALQLSAFFDPVVRRLRFMPWRRGLQLAWKTVVVRSACPLLCLLVLAWLTLQWGILPHIEDWRPEIERHASRAVGVPVRIGHISVRSSGWIPALDLRDVVLRDASGAEALRLPRVRPRCRRARCWCCRRAWRSSTSRTRACWCGATPPATCTSAASTCRARHRLQRRRGGHAGLVLQPGGDRAAPRRGALDRRAARRAGARADRRRHRAAQRPALARHARRRHAARRVGRPLHAARAHAPAAVLVRRRLAPLDRHALRRPAARRRRAAASATSTCRSSSRAARARCACGWTSRTTTGARPRPTCSCATSACASPRRRAAGHRARGRAA